MPKRILIVDDEPAVRDLLEALLVAEGYLVRMAEDGIAALAALEDGPDLVVTDLMHPGLPGEAIAAACLERGIPVLLTSAGRGDPGLPGVPFLAKPFDFELFLATVAVL